MGDGARKQDILENSLKTTLPVMQTGISVFD